MAAEDGIDISRFFYPGQHQFEGVTYADVMPAETLVKIRDQLTFHPSDVIIATYPKSGTTWMEEIVYSIMEGSQKAKERTECMDAVIPFIEQDLGIPGLPSNYHRITTTNPPHIVKTHLNTTFFKRALDTTENGPKFIVIVRNPKDTLTSFYYFHRSMRSSMADLSWEEFFELFKKNKLIFGNVFDYHIGWWLLRNHRNVLFLQYEDMLVDKTKAIRQVAYFLGRHLSEEELAVVAEASSFQTMKARGFDSYHEWGAATNDAGAHFFRKGVKGDWRAQFTKAQSDYVDSLVQSRVTPVGLSYNF